MVDGLGHGEFAAMAADEAVRVFQENRNPDLVEQMQYLHGALKKTRGAAVALARLDAGRRQLAYVGVGNITGCIVTQHRVEASCHKTARWGMLWKG